MINFLRNFQSLVVLLSDFVVVILTELKLNNSLVIFIWSFWPLLSEQGFFCLLHCILLSFCKSAILYTNYNNFCSSFMLLLFHQSRNRAQNILPCTTAEILSAAQNDDKFYSGEIELSQVCVIFLWIFFYECLLISSNPALEFTLNYSLKVLYTDVEVGHCFLFADHHCGTDRCS